MIPSLSTLSPVGFSKSSVYEVPGVGGCALVLASSIALPPAYQSSQLRVPPVIYVCQCLVVDSVIHYPVPSVASSVSLLREKP